MLTRFSVSEPHHQPIKIIMLGAGLDVKGGITSVEKLILDNAPPQLHINHVATFAQGSGIHNLKVFFQAALTLFLTLLTGKADLVHIHFSERGSTLRKLPLILITLLFRKPLILHCHGAAYREFYEQLPIWTQQLLSLILRQCSKFISLSQSWQKYYAEKFKLTGEQTIVLNNPVQFPPQIPNRQEHQQITFLFLGRIGKRGGALDQVKSVQFPKQDKGAFDLIQAFAALPEEDRASAQLILAGNGEVEKAQQLIQELGIANQATVYSWVDSQQRDALLAQADVFVLPSYHEGLPMSMLEAMAWELAVITTPVGGIPEVITHQENGLLIQPGNQQQLQENLQKLIQNPGLRQRLGTKAYQSVQSLNVHNYLLSLLELYTSTVRQKPSPVRRSKELVKSNS